MCEGTKQSILGWTLQESGLNVKFHALVKIRFKDIRLWIVSHDLVSHSLRRSSWPVAIRQSLSKKPASKVNIPSTALPVPRRAQ